MANDNLIETPPYDSTVDTMQHIGRVFHFLNIASGQLMMRAVNHDRSKLSRPEKAAYDKATPKLREATYGTPEYFAAFEPMKEAIAHHYRVNRHHPEHHVSRVFYDAGRARFTYDKELVADGTAISRMTLIDLLEMLCDWRAASERHADGDFESSLEYNKKRFGISDQLASILHSTALDLGLI